MSKGIGGARAALGAALSVSLLVTAACSSPSESALVAGVTQLPEQSARSLPTTTSSTTAPTTTTASTTAPTTIAEVPVLEADLEWLAASEGPEVQITASVRTTDGIEVWGLNPELRLFPASNQKLLVAAGVSELLEPDQRFLTVAAINPTDPETLYVIAGGDPTMTTDRLRDLARVVSRDTTGPFDRLVLDTSRWKTAYRAPGWQDWHIPTYVGPLSTFMLDDNRWSKSEDFTDAPDLTNASQFVAYLRAVGVRGELTPSLGSVPDDVDVIARSESPSVDRLMITMLRSSDNQIADALVREIDSGLGHPATTTGGLGRIRLALLASGVDVSGIEGDGSGLSRGNLRSASEWTALLSSLPDEPWFAEFEAALPVAGRSGTMSARLRGTPAAGNVRAKTGTIIGGRSLSGYVRLASGEDVSFSIVVNGEGSHGILDEIDRWVVDLASGRIGP